MTKDSPTVSITSTLSTCRRRRAILCLASFWLTPVQPASQDGTRPSMVEQVNAAKRTLYRRPQGSDGLTYQAVSPGAPDEIMSPGESFDNQTESIAGEQASEPPESSPFISSDLPCSEAATTSRSDSALACINTNPTQTAPKPKPTQPKPKPKPTQPKPIPGDHSVSLR